MQFYIVHPDPHISAKLLPDYALNEVNLREGWQILSDIGHIHSVIWSGQNACFSKSHALTRQFCSRASEFGDFVCHYRACCDEYVRRYGKSNSFIDRFFKVPVPVLHSIVDKLPSDRYDNVRRYLLSEKRSHLTQAEILRLERGPNEDT